MGKFLPPLVHIQNHQRVMGIIFFLRYGVPTNPTPPPPPWGARRLTARPADPPRFGSTKGGGEPPAPPPSTPKTVAHPSGSHIGWQQPPCRRHMTHSGWAGGVSAVYVCVAYKFQGRSRGSWAAVV